MKIKQKDTFPCFIASGMEDTAVENPESTAKNGHPLHPSRDFWMNHLK